MTALSRRGILGSTLALAAPVATLAAPSPISLAARQLGVLWPSYHAADQIRDYDECGRVCRAMRPLELEIIAASPTSAADAVIMLTVASCEILSANASLEGEEAVETCALAVQRVVRFLADASGVDLRQIAGESYLIGGLDGVS